MFALVLKITNLVQIFDLEASVFGAGYNNVGLQEKKVEVLIKEAISLH